MKRHRLVILGCGNVGGTLTNLLIKGQFPAFEISKIIIKDPLKARSAEVQGERARLPLVLPAGLLSSSAEEHILDDDTDIVVDATAADTTQLLLEAMRAGKHVVSANKKFIARDGSRLKAEACAAGVLLLHEATVMAKVPVICGASIRRHLQPQAFHACVSGTCGYILGEMRENSTDFEAAVLQARSLGYAESDPSADVDAHDAAAKARILAHELLGANSLTPDGEAVVLREGIRSLPGFAHRFAAATGRVVELVASGIVSGDSVGVSVLPTLVRRDSFLGRLRGVENGIVVEDLVGPALESSGPGAGGLATAAAIAMDLAVVAERGKPKPTQDSFSSRSLLPKGRLCFRAVFLSASPESKHGVLAAKLRTLADNGLSVENLGNDPGGAWDEYGETFSYDAIAVEAASFDAIEKARIAFADLDCVKGKVFILRILGDEPLAFVPVGR